jgi:hypothetical protein
MKKVLAILLAVLFVISLTVGAASACNSHGHHHICDSDSTATAQTVTPVAMVIAVTGSLVINVIPKAKPYVKAILTNYE